MTTIYWSQESILIKEVCKILRRFFGRWQKFSFALLTKISSPPSSLHRPKKWNEMLDLLNANLNFKDNRLRRRNFSWTMKNFALSYSDDAQPYIQLNLFLYLVTIQLNLILYLVTIQLNLILYLVTLQPNLILYVVTTQLNLILYLVTLQLNLILYLVTIQLNLILY